MPLVFVLSASGPEQPASLSPPPTDAVYVMAFDITNNWDLYTKAPDTVWPSNDAASLVKFCTAIILMDNKSDSLSETITVTAADIVTGTTAELQEDDVISYTDLLGGLLLPSGNDASFAIGRTVGDFIWDQAGQTGTQGVVRFVEAMNDKASALGLTNTIFTTPSGVNAPGNFGTVRDFIALANASWNIAVVRTQSGQPTHTITITGVNARTYDVRHTSPFISGPWNTPSLGLGYDGVIASKTANEGASIASVVTLWESPNGTQIIMITIDTDGLFDRFMDMSGLILQIKEDFPYLTDGVAIVTDPSFSSVTVLSGADNGFVDDSNVGRTLTNFGATRITNAIYGSHSYSFDGINDHIDSPDAADLSMGSSDFLIECYYRGTGTEPALGCFVGKYDSPTDQREWVLMYDPTGALGQIFGFVSFDGTGFTEIPGFVITPTVFFNGATRHVAMRRVGSEFSIMVDGERTVASVTNGSALFSGTAKFMIGARQENTTGIIFPMEGIIDEVRITKGDARSSLRKTTPTGQAFPRSA